MERKSAGPDRLRRILKTYGGTGVVAGALVLRSRACPEPVEGTPVAPLSPD